MGNFITTLTRMSLGPPVRPLCQAPYAAIALHACTDSAVSVPFTKSKSLSPYLKDGKWP